MMYLMVESHTSPAFRHNIEDYFREDIEIQEWKVRINPENPELVIREVITNPWKGYPPVSTTNSMTVGWFKDLVKQLEKRGYVLKRMGKI